MTFALLLLVRLESLERASKNLSSARISSLAVFAIVFAVEALPRAIP